MPNLERSNTLRFMGPLISELLEPTARVKSADKMLMLPSLFDGKKPEKAKTHYEWVQSLY